MIEERVERRAVGDLHAQDLGSHLAREPIEARHQHDHQADDDRGDNAQQVEACANSHTDCHREENEAHVAGLFDRISKADD